MKDSAEALLRAWIALEDERLPDGGPRHLFRGGARLHDRLVSPLARLADRDEELARAAHAVCRRCRDVASESHAFAHDPLEALAWLACHGWPTPLVGFTASARTAFAFAGERGGERGVVTRLDRAALPDRLVACSAGFLGLGLEEEEAEPAWLQQRGVGVTDREWRRFENAVDLDLKAHDSVAALEEHELDLDGLDADEEALGTTPAPALALLRPTIEKVGRKVLGPRGVGALQRLLDLR